MSVETTAAIRLSLGAFGVAVGTYLGCGLLIRPDTALVRVGMRDEYEFILRDADAATRGERPVVWLVGSSVVREAFDAAVVEELLNARGVDVDVEKFAFNRGTPLFTRALLRHLPIAAGDTVITSVAEDNFTAGWLHEADDLEGPAAFLLDPQDVWALPGLGLRERVDLTLAMAPPRAFHRHRDDFGRGLAEWAAARWGDRALRVRDNVRFQPFTRGASQTLLPPDRMLRRKVKDDELILDASQENWSALLGWIDDVRALGAAPEVLVVPHHPDYGRHFASDAAVMRFNVAIDGLDAPVLRLPAAGRDDYADWNHPNDAGRMHYTRAFVDALVERRAGASPFAPRSFRPAEPWVRFPRGPAADAPRGDDPVVEAAIDEANTLTGEKWKWAGRGTDDAPGLDCLGLVFRAYSRATGTAVDRYSGDPSVLVASGLLGHPVPGLDGVLRDDLDRTLLRRGDVLYFLLRDSPIDDDPLWTDDGSRYWPWHVGLYVDEGHGYAMNSHPSYGVVRMPLDEVQWHALFVTRLP